jgi:3D (Asp-Asp-Asp) domain-containing protein
LGAEVLKESEGRVMRKIYIILLLGAAALYLIYACYLICCVQSYKEGIAYYNDYKGIEKAEAMLRHLPPYEYTYCTMELTYYCDCEKCTGHHVTTATGTIPKEGYTVAVDPKVIPLGTDIYIENLGWRHAEDVGGGVKGARLDVFVASHEDALNRGRHAARIHYWNKGGN